MPRRFLLVALWLAATASSLAQPQTYQIPIQTNWNAITYQFDGVKRVTTDLGLTPQFRDQMMVFEPATQTFSNYVYFNNVWQPSEPTLAPGQGVFYFSHSSFMWTVTGFPSTPALPLDLPTGVMNLVGCQTDTTATFDQIAGYPATDGTRLYRLPPGSPGNVTSCQQCFLAYSNVGGIWQPTTPVANIGESVFIYLPGANDVADLGISIASSPEPLILSNSVSFIVAVTNAGPSLASNVVATTYLPEGVSYNYAFADQGGVSEANGAVTCQIGDLWPGAAVNITINATATEPSIQVFTTASVTSDTSDTNLDNNATSLLSTILSANDLNLPFWFTSTIITNQQLLLTLSGPANQTVEVDVSHDLATWTFAFNLTLTNGVGSMAVPLSQLPGGTFYRAQYTPTQGQNGTPPTFTILPQSQTVDVGQTVVFTAQASGSDPLGYQWMLNSTNLIGENSSTLTLYSVTAADAGMYTLVVTNFAGATNASANLTVRQWNYGIAPDPSYPTLLASGGARHQVVAGFSLGTIETAQDDATPEPSDFMQLTALPPGNDGVILPSVLVPNQMASVQVIASLPGKLDAWIDFNGNGNWADANDQVCASLSLAQGTNNVMIAVPSTAVSGQTWARFRFSSAGGLSFSGDAPDGEVEDYPVTISDSPNLSLTVSATPNPVAVGNQLTYLLSVTNAGAIPAFNVAVTNILAAGITSEICSSSQGTCISNNGAVIGQLGSLNPGGFATVTITVTPGAEGCLTNIAMISADEPNSNPGGGAVTTVIKALTLPYIITGPSDLYLNQGDIGVLSVTAGGSPPLAYQWLLNGSPIALGTDSSLTLFPAAPSDAGSYTVQVSNGVGSVISLPATVTVQPLYNVSAVADTGGTINPAGDTLFNAGASPTFTATPNPGYTVDSWYLDGNLVLTNQTQFTLTNISSDHAISVTFDNLTNYDTVPIAGNWYYNTNGVDLGTNWSQPGYDFSSWSNGPALFGVPANSNLYPVPFGTALQVGDQITYYFLTQFQWNGSTSNVTLTATNYITSGAVFYLNGTQVGQLRMTNNPVLYTSTAQPQTNAGQAEILNFPSSALVQGTNVLAVEVHQTSPASPDVAFAMDLNATAAPKSTVAVNPTELTLNVGQTAQITATGSPLPVVGSYRWSTSTNGIPSGQQGQVMVNATDSASNSVAQVKGTAPGMINVQVQYTGGSNAPSEAATCVVNVIQSQMTLGSSNSVSGSAPLFNPAPIVVLNNLPDPGTGVNPQVQVTGTVTSFIAPIAADHIFINGVPAASATVVSDGTNGLGPFVRNFTSQKLFIGDDDFSITAAAVNALNNIGYESIDITVNRNADGSIGSRSLTNNPSVSAMPTNLTAYIAPYRCRVQISDAKQAAATNTITARITTGVDTRTLNLTNVSGSSLFVSQDLFFVPMNLALPGGTSAGLAATRIKAQFGSYINVNYQSGAVPSTTQIVPTGVLLVQNRNPLSFIQSGVAADVTAGSRDLPFTIEAGIDTRSGPVDASVIVTSLDKFQQNLTAPAAPANQYAPVQLSGNAMKMIQASAVPSSAQYNLYTCISPPIMALRRQMPLNANGAQQPNGNVSPLTVTYRGYVSVALPSIGATNIEPVAGIGYLLANPASPTSTNLNPPMVESDFLPLFNPNPIVVISSPLGPNQIAPVPATVPVQGQIINFINPMVQANVTVNGNPVTTFTPDANSPQYGPWRATFSHTFPIDPQLPYQIAGVAVWDNLKNMGLGKIAFTAVGGGIDANGVPIPVTATLPDNAAFTVPTSPVVSALVQSNNITLAAAMSMFRNNQFRIEANPILRGNLPWMFNNTGITVRRQTDGAGTTDAVSEQVYPFDVTTNADGIIKGGGGAATARLVLIPQLVTPDNVVPPAPGGAPKVLSFRANPGVFVRAFLNGLAGSRPALASPNGALIMRNVNVQTDTVVPGTYADVGGNPADISVLLRVGANGFDPAAGTGRATVPATFNTLDLSFSGPEVQFASRQISRNDLAPVGAMDRQQWENFPTVAQNLTLGRLSNDPTDPRFNLFLWQQAAAPAKEQLMTTISTGTYPSATQRNPMQVSTVDNMGLQFAQPMDWVQLQSAALPNNLATAKPVFGATLFNAANTSTQTGNNGVELPNNFSGHSDFCIQLQERPIELAGVNAGPPTAAPVNNFWLRVERTFVDPATDLVPAASTGDEVVAYFDVDQAANFQATVTLSSAGYYRFPPSGAGYQNLMAIGGTGAGTERPAVPSDIALSTSQTTFEGLNLPNVRLTQNNPTTGNPRRALPPGRYYVRPVMLSPTGGGRYVLGRRYSFTVPYVVNFIQLGAFAGDMLGTYGLISGPKAPPAVPAGLTAAQQKAMQQAYLAQWARIVRSKYGTATSAANRDVYVANTPNIRVVHPNIPLPQIMDYVVPVNIGGNNGVGSYGGASTLDVLNNLTDEGAFTGTGGIFVSGFLGAGGAPNTSIFAAFTGANAPYGALAGDNPNNLQNALNGDILAMGGPINLLPPMQASRDDLAKNAATALSRSLGRTIAHEIGHTLGLVAPRQDIIGYLAANVAGAPQARANAVRVGSDWSFNAGAPGQSAHNGQIYRTRYDKNAGKVPPMAPDIIMIPVPGPPAALVQAAGDLPTFDQAVKAWALAKWAPVSDCEDLFLPALNQNLLMDSGSFGLFPERIEGASSGVTCNPVVAAEPAAAFLGRNLLQIRAVLPRN